MSQTCELVISEVLVTLKNGDITKQNVDALVNLNNSTLDQELGISKAILAAGGTCLREECKQLGKLPHGDVVVTGAGDLPCKHVIHVIHATRPQSIVNAVKKVLGECDKNDLCTVAFPALGTGLAGLSVDESIKSLLKGIREYLDDCMSHITQIVIVTFTENIYQGCLAFMKSEITKLQNPNLSLTICGTIVELVLGDITKQAVDCILNLTNDTLDQRVGVSGAILSAAGSSVVDECSVSGTMPENGILVTTGGDLKSKNIMHIIGPTSISAFAPSLEKILNECHTKSFKTIALPAIGTGIARLDPEQSIQGILDGIKKSLSKMNVSSFNKILIIAFNENIQKAYSQVFQREIRNSQETQQKADIMVKVNKGLIGGPDHWKHMGQNNYMSVILHKDSAEYKNVANNFMSAKNKNVKLISIERIQNAKLWASYAIHKLHVDIQYPYQDNEKHLYHGTTYEATKKINHHGFNRSFNGKNATVFGKGTYFARDASLSCQDLYSVRDENGKKYVYQAAVITGRFCLGHSSYIEPPATQENPTILFNTTADRVNDPSLFVIYGDCHAYPEYLITFK
ncbi:protein mono-ADP-ribosyltransferase PARP15-like [Spea bombifrons]|uniref:protein mono-ADP-ribosyltransferase PARP15-like n=1 Tax=Spea bombifrons TaxID=233779 RepID=UPI00234AF0E4|nr:protein mono-ADP-ribosyltransferase PARP15-like [Spea bombifrons]